MYALKYVLLHNEHIRLKLNSFEWIHELTDAKLIRTKQMCTKGINTQTINKPAFKKTIPCLNGQ